MCGIAGSVNYNFEYSKVTRCMGHRGPDEQNGYLFNNVNLFHLRLSILDISCGSQPMHLDSRYSIIFNGEIYNHKELRTRFNLNGQTHSDTETLLMLYAREGKDFLRHLDGMFAFVILDKLRNELFIARDRAGKKPFYYFRDKGVFIFASELNALKAMHPLQVDEQNIFQYLRLGSFYRQCTPYRNVTELNAGTYLTVDIDTLETRQVKWWDVHDYYLNHSKDSFADSLKRTDEILHTAVKRRLETSDLEVGCFLSGGIDSGLITAIASKYKNDLKTFTVSFDGEYNEAPLARLVAEKYGTHHTEIRISFDSLKNDLEMILGNYGEPFFDSSAIPSYYVSRESKKHVTVVLNGDGADELFGGYRRYVPFARYDFFRKSPIINTAASLFASLAKPPDNKKSLYNYLYRLAALASRQDLEIYLSAGVDIFEGYGPYIKASPAEYLQAVVADFQKITNSPLSGLRKIMNLDFDVNLASDLLVKMDIATMANSQEGRSAFLCREFLEYIPSLPDDYKIRGKTTKYLLRTLAKSYLPDQIINQPKRGFEIPLKTWIDKELKEHVHDHLGASNAFYNNYVEKTFVKELLDQHSKVPAEKRAKILFTLLSLEIWHKKYRNG